MTLTEPLVCLVFGLSLIGLIQGTESLLQGETCHQAADITQW